MSALDQFVMEDVAKHCPNEFMQYHKCISMNHEDPSQCDFRQRDLAVCIKQKVPVVQDIMKHCSAQMQRYEQCIRDHMESRTINENCLGLMAEMRSCAERQTAGKARPINELGGRGDERV
ncbi:ABL097Cp [Eremothecium gossypii ATCC 10895]|uniref:ABL097Cp n=1 Tax=Eremothecium gossypii (strain ATCC 10895 / CBS 109.51 / FGSC 9923 / NRRL Y-1056) TaxID=284811 RepID=Q75DX0_EREGS|nr:ABL097Cp [Eremothecium gossypii ATCC 10895]AAS50674.1 ABL097Cp [Eremothecium gossypii ATCC 10895]AEY94962.1 FABL097Cp [Eremothecium gossypii FDAG1]